MELSGLIRGFLQPARFAVLSTINVDGTPQQTVVWYDLDGDEILMNSAYGRRKDRNLRHDPRASFCVEDGYTYVTINGSVSLIDDQAIAQRDIERLAIRYDGKESAERQMQTQFSREERVTIRLRVTWAHAFGL